MSLISRAGSARRHRKVLKTRRVLSNYLDLSTLLEVYLCSQVSINHNKDRSHLCRDDGPGDANGAQKASLQMDVRIIRPTLFDFYDHKFSP